MTSIRLFISQVFIEHLVISSNLTLGAVILSYATGWRGAEVSRKQHGVEEHQDHIMACRIIRWTKTMLSVKEQKNSGFHEANRKQRCFIMVNQVLKIKCEHANI